MESLYDLPMNYVLKWSTLTLIEEIFLWRKERFHSTGYRAQVLSINYFSIGPDKFKYKLLFLEFYQKSIFLHTTLMGKNTVQEMQWFDIFYPDSAPSKQMVEKWFADFERGRTTDRKLKLHEIADTLKIWEGSVFTILHEHFSIRKLSLKWVPRLLTIDQKQQRVDNSKHCLEMFQCN